MNILDKLQGLFRSELCCRDVNDFLERYVADDLDGALKTCFEKHIDRCPNCRIYLDQYRATISAVKATEASVPVPDDLVAYTLAFLRENMGRNA